MLYDAQIVVDLPPPHLVDFVSILNRVLVQ
jgi:hypothetical protein